MAININDNLNVLANKAIDRRYGPFETPSDAITAIPLEQRYRGLTVGIGDPVVVEYWFKDGTDPSNFVPKTSSGNLTGITEGNGISVSGSATNPTVAIDPVVVQEVANISTNVITDGASDAKYPSVKAVKTYVDNEVVGLLNDRGSFAPSTSVGGAYPSSGGSGTPSGTIMKGDLWYIRSQGYLGNTLVPIGASVRALKDSPSPTTDADWDILDAGLGYIPEDSANKVTSGTSISSAPNDPTKYPSIKALTEYLASAPTSVPSLQQVLTSGTNTNISTGTSIIVQNSGVTQISTIGVGSISLTNTGTSRTVALGSDDRIRVQVGNNFTTYEATQITFNGSGTQTTLRARPSASATVFIPAPATTRTMAVSVNGSFADDTGNITLSQVVSGTQNVVPKINSTGNELEDSNIYNASSKIGMFTTNPRVGANSLQVGNSGTLQFPTENIVAISGGAGGGLGVYSSSNTAGAGPAIYLGDATYTTSGRFPAFQQQLFTDSNSADGFVVYNYIERNTAGNVVESMIDIFKMYVDGRVEINADSPNKPPFITPSPKLAIGLPVTDLDASTVLQAQGDVVFSGSATITGPVQLSNYSSSNPSGSSVLLTDTLGNLTTVDTPTGTQNKLLKWNTIGLLDIGDSQILDNGTNVGIATASPTAKLDVNGTFRASGAVTLANLSGTGTRLVQTSSTGVISAVAVSTGTQNRVAKWNNSGVFELTNSQIFDNGTTVGINNTSPGADYKLDVTGKSKFSDVLQVGTAAPISGITVDTGNPTTNIEANIATNKAIATSRGINISAIDPTSGSANKTGIYAAGNRIEFFAGNNKVGSFGLFVSNGAFLELDSTLVPNNAGNVGVLNGLKVQCNVANANTANNTTDQHQIIINPSINQSVGSFTGSGILRGIYYNPTITNIGPSASKHIAIETVNGDVLLGTGTYSASNGGYVGIGSGWTPGSASTMPQRPLHIRDVMRLEPRATAPSSPSAGDIYYDSTVNKLRIYNGTSWKYVQFEP